MLQQSRAPILFFSLVLLSVKVLADQPPATESKRLSEAVGRWVDRLEKEIPRLAERERPYYAFSAAGDNASIGRLERAHDLIAELEGSSRRIAFKRFVVGVAEWDVEDAVKAVAVLESADERADALSEIAWSLYRKGDLESALKVLEPATANLSTDRIYSRIAEAYAAEERFDRARALLPRVSNEDRNMRDRTATYIQAAALVAEGTEQLDERARSKNLDLTDLADALRDLVWRKSMRGSAAEAERIALQIPQAGERVDACVRAARGYARAGDAASVRRLLDAAHQAERQVKGSLGSEELTLYWAEAEIGDADRALAYERKKNEEAERHNAKDPKGFLYSISRSFSVRVFFRRKDYATAIEVGSKVDPWRGDSEADSVARHLVEHGRVAELETWFEATTDPMQRARICGGAIDGLRAQLRKARGWAIP